MRYKIVERNDGMFDIFYRHNFFYEWKYLVKDMPTLEKAKDIVELYIDDHRKIKMRKEGKKIKRTVAIFKA